MGVRGGKSGRNGSGNGRIWAVKAAAGGGEIDLACQPVIRGGPGRQLVFTWRGPSGDEARTRVAADLSEAPWFGVGSALVPLRTGDLVEFVGDDIFDGHMIVRASGRAVRVARDDFERL